MTDRLTADARSSVMRRIKAKNTQPELVVRRLIYHMGYRYRLHKTDLPGKPDLVFLGRRKVVFVHGCFWHQHLGCRRTHIPKSNQDYWSPKLERNVIRDKAARSVLEAMGWTVMVVWECEASDEAVLGKRLRQYLDCTAE